MSGPLVAVDARHLKSGIGTYLDNLVPRLVASTDWRWNLIGPERWRELESDRVTWSRSDEPIYTIREHFEVTRLATGADLLWVPQYNAPWFWKGRLVVTLHDLIHRMTEYTPPSFKTWVSGRLMARSLARASRIITVSEYSRRRLGEFFPGREDKCTVIPNGVQAVPEADAPDIEDPYVLCFGNGLPHKNLLRLMEAFVALEGVPEILVIAGPEGRSSESIRSFADRHPDRILVLGPQDRAGWAALLQHARLYACPSLEEGFGLPPLEALSAGIPVVAARAASLPEVLGDAAIWCDPRNTQSIGIALRRGLDDDDERRRIQKLGPDRVARHDWDRSARAHALVIEACLES